MEVIVFSDKEEAKTGRDKAGVPAIETKRLAVTIQLVIFFIISPELSKYVFAVVVQ